MKPTLLVLAAGMGSRYGGLKQLDPVGPSGEIIIDFSIYDAIQAGFGKVVFLIRKDIDILNIGNAKTEINMLELAKMIKYLTKSKSKIKTSGKRKNEIKYRIPDTSKMENLYKCKYFLKDTIEYILEDLEQTKEK